jgi:hypothetical protein
LRSCGLGSFIYQAFQQLQTPQPQFIIPQGQQSTGQLSSNISLLAWKRLQAELQAGHSAWMQAEQVIGLKASWQAE